MTKPNRPLYLIIGPSGSGKDTIVDRVCGMMRVNKIRSCTTRPRRDGEPEDAHYFVGDAEFDRLREPTNGLAAETTYDGHRYGATWAEVEAGDLYIIDPAGAALLNRELIGRPVYEVYISASRHSLMTHMALRGDTLEDIRRRIEHDRSIYDAYEEACTWKYRINTSLNSPQKSAEELAAIIAQHWPEEEE